MNKGITVILANKGIVVLAAFLKKRRRLKISTLSLLLILY